MSRDAVLDGSKAIRGGIPIVFPIFGPPSDDSGMPQHGFARTNQWTYDPASLVDNETEASVEYSLAVTNRPSDIKSRGTKGLWMPTTEGALSACELRYKIVLHWSSLNVTLTMKNTGDVAFPVQALLHTYYFIHDKGALDPKKKESSDDEIYVPPEKQIKVTKEADRVYIPPANWHKDELYARIGVGSPKQRSIVCEAKAWVGGTPVPVSCVVWNPFDEKAKAMSDFGDDQYHEMICVESGMLGDTNVLEPGQQAVLKQMIQV